MLPETLHRIRSRRIPFFPSLPVWLAYDGGDFEDVKTIGGEDGAPKDTYVVPLILRRCDRWQLRLTGTQEAVIYSIAVERYGGEWQQAK